MQRILNQATIAVALFVLFSFASEETCHGQDLAQASPHQNPNGEYLGSLECSRCHEEPTTVDTVRHVTDFVALDEFKRWIDTDIHARSFMQIIPSESMFDLMKIEYAKVQSPKKIKPILQTSIKWSKSNELSREMCNKLGYDPDTLKADSLEGTEFARDCLTCHAGYEHKTDSLAEEVELFGVGVGCESCHGPSSNWKDAHAKESWREIDPLEKAGIGMIDVRNPAVRTTQCLSCHVGNQEEHKVVTHRMYAAGHPPLPSIEVESFSQQTSRHWRSLAEKPDFKSRDVFAELHHKEVGDFSESRTVAIGGVAALRESLALVSDVAKGDSLQWPEFAAFDCAACHHDLRSDSWRRERGFRGRPGRPTLHAWPDALVKIGIVNVANNRNLSDEELKNLLAQYDAHRNDLQKVLDDQPFGKPAELAGEGDDGAAKKLVAWLDQLLWVEGGDRRVSLKGFGQEQAIETLYMLSGARPDIYDPAEEIVDFNSARQVAWAIDAISSELLRRNDAAELPFDINAVRVNVDQMNGKMQLTLPGESTLFKFENMQGETSWLRYIKSDSTKVFLQNVKDRSQVELTLDELNADQQAIIVDGFGRITDKQEELFKAIYGFDRKAFLTDLEQLKKILDSPGDHVKAFPNGSPENASPENASPPNASPENESPAN